MVGLMEMYVYVDVSGWERTIECTVHVLTRRSQIYNTTLTENATHRAWTTACS